MWYQTSTFYQIYPLGFCGAPPQNNGQQHHNITKATSWIPHLQNLGVGAVLFNPLLESDAHGYDARDFTKIDARLGTNGDFAEVCRQLHAAGLRVVLDGVFNHVGRGFWAFLDVQKNRQNSAYKDWFYIDFNRDSNYGDGFWYEGWEGHFELVKLNLNNYEVVEHLLNCVAGWIKEFDIDGLRLDVAYTLNEGFMRRLRHFTDAQKPEFFLMGEMLHGDYKNIAQQEMLHSATNYECYKGMYSSLNTLNFFEIAYSLNRQFGPEDWTLYKEIPLFNFVDNHDVTRAASVLQNPAHLPLLYGLLFGIPGIPCVYYGSEWGAQGLKQQGSDASLRPSFEAPIENELFATICKMVHIRNGSGALNYGSYQQIYLTNKQFVFQRQKDGERILLAFNAEETEHIAHFNAQAGTAVNLLTGAKVDFGGGLVLPPYSVQFLQMER
ncbi:maltodextrin glucosidase [Ruminococcaceae bacterium OttesenSCG-928-A16]|nr:maltodextrin glucosidase [Ruminococcaceae bacterium OttesenSCG-928-A16]